MSDVEWTNEAVINLMEEYRKRPELWDNRHDLYRVQTAKYEAWSDLAALFECDIADLRKKLNSIFASHRREKAKVRIGGRSTWFLYPYMKFLPTHLDNNEIICETITNTSDTKQQQGTEDAEESSDEDNLDDSHDSPAHEEILIKNEPIIITERRVKQSKKLKQYETHKPRLTRPFKRRVVKEKSASQLDSRLLETLRILRKSDLTRKKDECDSFGEYIADSLRKHDDRTQSMIKQAINNILFEQEMKKYSAGQYAVVIAGIDENPLILSEDNPNK